MIRRPPRSTLDRSSAASDVYKRQLYDLVCDWSRIILSLFWFYVCKNMFFHILNLICDWMKIILEDACFRSKLILKSYSFWLLSGAQVLWFVIKVFYFH